MRSAFYQHAFYSHRASPRRRIAALVLTFIAVALLLLVLLRLAPAPMGQPGERSLSTFQVLPDSHPKASPAHAAPKHATTKAEPKPVTPPVPPVTPPPLPPTTAPQMILLSKADMDAADVRNLPSHDDDGPSGAADSGSDKVVGQGSNGQPLYEAQWYRQPTQAELDFYLPHDQESDGWALIACRTIANYRVDSCQKLGDSPSDSGRGYAMVQAAWQFRVRPPRVGGHSLVGSWVRILITFEGKKAS